MRSYKFSVSFSSAYFSSKEINRVINPITTIINVIIKDLEREKGPSIKSGKNLNESILAIKEITKILKRDIFLFL